MKRVLCGIVLCVISLMLVSCKNSVTPEQPGSFVADGENRFVLVDAWEETQSTPSFNCQVFADKYTGVMYLFVDSGYKGGVTPLYCDDGSLMIYDGF